MTEFPLSPTYCMYCTTYSTTTYFILAIYINSHIYIILSIYNLQTKWSLLHKIESAHGCPPVYLSANLHPPACPPVQSAFPGLPHPVPTVLPPCAFRNQVVEAVVTVAISIFPFKGNFSYRDTGATLLETVPLSDSEASRLPVPPPPRGSRCS